MVVHELLQGNAVMAFSLSSQFMYVPVCDLSYIVERCCILGEGKQLSGKTLGLQYPVWLLCNIASDVKTRTVSQ